MLFHAKKRSKTTPLFLTGVKTAPSVGGVPKQYLITKTALKYYGQPNSTPMGAVLAPCFSECMQLGLSADNEKIKQFIKELH